MQLSDVTVLVHLRLLPDFVEQGKRDLLDFARVVKRSEPDCLGIEIVHDIDDPTRITMIEKWSNREAYVGPHLQTKHMKSFIDRSARYFDGSAEISFCNGTIIGRSRDKTESPPPPYGR